MSYRSRFKSAADAIEEEARKLQANEETAIVYQQFIETFEEPVKVNKTWVKGGTVNPGSSTHNVEGAGKFYQPYLKTVDKPTEKLKEKLQIEFNEKPPLLGKLKEQSKKKSNLEAFSEELKQLQQEREMRQMKRKQGSERMDDGNIKFTKEPEIKILEEPRKSRFDMNLVQANKPLPILPMSSPFDLDFPYDSETDRTTTNLFLGNLNPELTEQQLCELFGRFGPLASVKIMWPRSDEEKARGRNCGFVAFMNRTDGERALDKLRGTEICGYEMKLGWGKTVLIPPHPIYVPPVLLELIKAPPPSGLPFNAQPKTWLQKGSNVERKIYDMYSISDEELAEILKNCIVKVTIPTDRPLLQLINRMVEFVVREGVEFEAFIMNKEMRNPHFKFLFDFQSPEHVYYRWKLYSILHGESTKVWKTEEFLMYKDGPVWRPPPLNPYTSGIPEELIEDIDFSKLTLENISQVLSCGDSLKESSNQANEVCMENPYSHNHIYKRQLTESQRERLIQTLIDLEPIKNSIGEAMVWCLEHADSAEDVLDIIVKQLEKIIGYVTDKSVENSTAAGLNQIVATLFLISDILHNSCAKVRNASFYRKYIENSLPAVMAALHQYYSTITSKLKSEQLKYKVLSCFRAWGDWYVYPFDQLQKLKNQFLGIVEPVQVVPDDKSVSNIAEENLLGGKPLVDYDGDPLDVDGVPLENTVKKPSFGLLSSNDSGNGEILDMFANPSSPQLKRAYNNDLLGNGVDNGTSITEKTALFVPSKWETVDPTEEEGDMIQSRWQLMEAQNEDKKSSDNEDPDGYPLSDNDENYHHVSKPLKSGHEKSPKSKKKKRRSHDSDRERDRDTTGDQKTVASLVSYGPESSDEEDDQDQDGVELTQYQSSRIKHERRRDSSPDYNSRRSTSKKSKGDGGGKSKQHDSGSRTVSTANIEIRSRVIRLDHRDDDSDNRMSGRSLRDSKRHYDSDQPTTGFPQNKRSRRSRSRSRSSRKSHKRKSMKH